MDGPKYQIIALISRIITILALSSLVIHAHITKETEHITFTWIVLILIAQCLLFIYGFINSLYGIYVPALLFISGVLYILYIKLIYNKNETIEAELKAKHIL
jgi:heme A synthase